MNKDEVRKKAKEILDKFSKSLEKVTIKKKELKRGAEGYRVEGKGKSCDADFRKKMFANAPNKDENCIIAEVKKWQ